MDYIESFYKEYIAQEGIFISTKKSRGTVIQNASTVYNAIKTNLDMCEKAHDLLRDFLLKVIKTRYDWDKAKEDAEAFKKKAIDLDYGRGSDDEMKEMSMSFLRLRAAKIFKRADLKHDEVKPEMLKLIKACSEDGIFGRKYKELTDKYVAIIADHKNEIEALSHDIESPNYAMMTLFRDEYIFFARQIEATNSDAKMILRKFNSSKFQ